MGKEQRFTLPTQRIYESAEFESEKLCYRIEELLPSGTYANPAGDIYYGEASITQLPAQASPVVAVLPIFQLNKSL